MSTKSFVYYDSDTDTHLYEEALWIEGEESPAFIELRNPKEFQVRKENQFFGVCVAIDTAIMDRLALAWCAHRNLGGPEQ